MSCSVRLLRCSVSTAATQQVVLEKYGVPDVDTTVHCMYGVPAPQINWNGDTDTDNENKQLND